MKLLKSFFGEIKVIMQQQPYNPSVHGPGRPFTSWKRSFFTQLPTEVRDRLLGEVVIPDVDGRLAQMNLLQTGINEFAERLMVNDDTITKQESKNHQTRLSLMAEIRTQIKEMREEIAKITAAGDCALQLIRETTAGPGFQSVMERFAGAPNRLIQGQLVLVESTRMWRGRPMIQYQEVLNEYNELQPARSKAQMLATLIKVKSLLQEFRSLQEEFPAEAEAGHFPAIPTDVAVVFFIRTKIADVDELRLIRDFIDSPRTNMLTLSQVEDNIIFHCQQQEQQ